MTAPAPDVVETRLAELLALLHERLSADAPMTEAEAMEFVRNAYMRGYFDKLLNRVEVAA